MYAVLNLSLQRTSTGQSQLKNTLNPEYTGVAGKKMNSEIAGAQ